MTVGYHIHIVFLALICCRGLSIWNLVTQFKGDVRDVLGVQFRKPREKTSGS